MSLTGNFCEDDNEEINTGYPSTHQDEYTDDQTMTVKRARHIMKTSGECEYAHYWISSSDLQEAKRVLRDAGEHE